MLFYLMFDTKKWPHQLKAVACEVCYVVWMGALGIGLVESIMTATILRKNFKFGSQTHKQSVTLTIEYSLSSYELLLSM